MAENIYYPNLGEIYARAAQVKNAMYEQQMAPIRMQNELVSNRINQLKAREIENEFATKMGRQEAAKKYFQPAQPAQTVAPMQTGAVPSYTGNQFAQSTYGQNVETAQARPAGFDVAGYQASRYGAGDIEGARAVQSGITDKDIVSVIKDLGTDKFKALKPMLSKLNPNFALIDENSLSISRNGEIAFPVLSPDGKPTGKGVIYGKDGNKQIVDIRGKDEGGTTEPALAIRAARGDKEAKAALDYLAKKRATNEQQMDFRNESAMRKEFLTLPEVKEYPTIDQQSKRALKALSDTSGNKVAVDQSIITTFNKMLDPSSVVRESEYARTPQDMALLNRIKGKWDKLSTGGAGLTDDERQAMFRMITAFKEVADNQYNEQVSYYSDLATRYGYKSENVVRLGGKKSETASPQPTGQPQTKAPAGKRPLPKF